LLTDYEIVLNTPKDFYFNFDGCYAKYIFPLDLQVATDTSGPSFKSANGVLRDERDKRDRDPYEWGTGEDAAFPKYLVFEGCLIQKYIDDKKSNPPTALEMEFKDLLTNPYSQRTTGNFRIEVWNEVDETAPGGYRGLIMTAEATVPGDTFKTGDVVQSTEHPSWTSTLSTV